MRKIEKLDGSFSIVRDINSEDDAVTLPSVYIEYSHSQFPVTMTLMSFLSYAQDKTHAFISSQDSVSYYRSMFLPFHHLQYVIDVTLSKGSARLYEYCHALINKRGCCS